MPEAVLSTDLAELAGPIGKNTGKAGVGEIGAGGPAAAVEAAAEGPAAIDAIFSGGVHAEGMLGLENVDGRQLVAGTPEELGTEKEILINGAAQRFPAQGGICRVQIGKEIRAEIRAQIAV